MFHRKHLPQKQAEIELCAIKMADRIDPSNTWHIGNAIVETKAELWTLKFPFGGRILYHIYTEDSKTILSVMKNIGVIIDGLVDFHKNHLYHRDLKLNNILYDKDHKVRIIDFGTALTELPHEEVDDIYKNIYIIWPFETIIVSGTKDNIFSNTIFDQYVNNDYFKPIAQFHQIDETEIRHNIINLRKTFRDPVELHREITKGIDVYSLGIALTHLILNKSVANALNNKQYCAIKSLTRQMIEPYTLDRLTMATVALKYQEIW